ncbi:MAG: DNA polymerase sliding clamp subunit PCNA [Candidatus Methanohalarchaeum thermophilum]|uniref:DNA polymerase sliding clamp n=1 Tax=Methanohalarchaeum thermophilum TaxID=1903181 RepID=A0A1Q6DW39_METT1|nr:MAG: DNA polymerase sliding clamp subunit PCNA [Candidatus Methanohalarchaeum thermophilum]
MSFEGKIKAGDFKKVIDSVSRLVDEIKLQITEDGVQTKASDPANVAMVILSINKEGFDSFSLDEEMEIGLDLDKLEDILGVASSSDFVELSTEDGSTLDVEVGGFEYNLSLLDPSTIQEQPEIPNLDLPSKIIMEGKTLKKAVKAAEKVSDYLILVTQGKKLTIKAEGDSDSVKLDLEEEDLIEIESEKDSRSLFSLDYLSDMSKSLSSADRVEMELGSDYPIKLKFPIVNEEGKVEYMLAPRIESE